ncbi:DUF171-domain-containing protein [Penicillium capsulatum]|uniref:DUF171-domain-containing protein n=1 Tax=Penicillium capsulatum TaxID=69766 RepID=A0A9W9I2D0_9EURO|nr:DUF171-domain-containing protein [Penicillium capsulatum]KAJ6117374.1 DUF171-domain-containing protein [Penicillium capsulatum]
MPMIHGFQRVEWSTAWSRRRHGNLPAVSQWPWEMRRCVQGKRLSLGLLFIPPSRCARESGQLVSIGATRPTFCRERMTPKPASFKKHQSSHGGKSTHASKPYDALDYTSKPSAVFTPTGGRSHTVSVALPGSIVGNAHSPEQKTLLAGAIARALAVFCVDEVVVFDDDENHTYNGDHDSALNDDEDLYNHGHRHEYTAYSDPSHFLAHVLSYLETPPYLRKHLFPMHPNLRTAGLLPSLDMPHHLRANEWCDYREGIVVGGDQRKGTQGHRNKQNKKRSFQNYSGDDSDESNPSHDGFSRTVVDTGLSNKVTVPATDLPKRTRVTVRLQKDGAQPVHPSVPRAEAGYYWGYYVRRAKSLSNVFTECPFDGGYDLSFGTSERGMPVHRILEDDSRSFSHYKHMLVVFGGVAGIEAAVRNDPQLQEMDFHPTDSEKLFDHWVNFLPGQGSRTIRTEEAVWLGLTSLRGLSEKK